MNDASSFAPGYRAATCPRCDGPFACGVGADRATPCFCAGFALDEPLLADLRARYAGCLCAACLAELARTPEARA